jgi:hypothetical protein
MFKVTLTSHGYTVAAKGTVLAFVQDLKYESKVYDRLRSVQGHYVPVCLGNIDLKRPYFYDVGVRIVHMMLLSWAGEQFDRIDRSSINNRRLLREDAARSIRAIHNLGVLHRDIRPPNVLWNKELRQAMVIDFERSEVLENDQLPLAPRSPNGRGRWSAEGMAAGGFWSKATHGGGRIGRNDGRLIHEEENFLNIVIRV